MNVFFGIDKFQGKFKNPIVAIGVFDGIHCGHQSLLKMAVAKAKAVKGTAIVMTFSPHPMHVLRPGVPLPLVISLPFRLKLMAQFGIKACVVIRFTKQFSRLRPQEFIQRYLVKKIKPRGVIVGDDFRFGKDRTGTVEQFRNAGKMYGFQVHTVRASRGGKKTVSSTQIRRLISLGRLTQAAKLLNRPVALLGRVVRGDARGKSLGYPTANLKVDQEVLPPVGVYLVRVILNGHAFPGLTNIGRRPSFKKKGGVSVEVHMIDFDRNIYGKELVVEFIKKVRNERSFRTKNDLIRQIQRDEQKARRWFAKHP